MTKCNKCARLAILYQPILQTEIFQMIVIAKVAHLTLHFCIGLTLTCLDKSKICTAKNVFVIAHNISP